MKARRVAAFASMAAGALLAAAARSPAAEPAGPAPEALPAAAPGPRPRVLRLDVKQVITAATGEYVASGLARARSGGYDLLLIVLDTPGGQLDVTRELVGALLVSDVPVAVWVGPAGARAGSAGTFITMAAHVAAMHPASNIGAAHPVAAGGEDIAEKAGKDMARKVENDTAAFARSTAKARGRNADWAEKAVRESQSITAEEALKGKVVDVVAPDVAAVLAYADGKVVEAAGAKRTIRSRDAIVEELPMTIRQRTLLFLADPNVAALLFLLGTLGIAVEFYHPGSIIPGVAGAFCLLLGFLAMRVIPVNAGAVLLLLAGVGLIVAEAYVTTHGIAGAAGAVSITVGTLLFIDRSSPDYRFDPVAFQLSPLVVWPTPLALSALLAFVAWKVASSRRGRLRAGAPGLVGEAGEALSDVGPEGGEVFVHGEYWRARAERSVAKGSRIKVVAVEGLRVAVEAIADDPPASSRPA